MQGALNSKAKFAKMVLDKTKRISSNSNIEFSSLLSKVKTLYSENLSIIPLIAQIVKVDLEQIEKDKLWKK